MKNKQKNIDKKKKKTKEKKKRGIGKKILLVILLIILVVVGWFAYKTYKNGGGLSGMLATAVGHDENTKKNLTELKVLVLGVSTDLDSELTDTIMVASYNPNTQKANLLSIPRDTFTGTNTATASPSHKINALYNLTKSPQKTLDAVNKITGLDIKYYVVVRTEALIELVDAIGGVEFDVPIDMVYDDPTQDLHINLSKGLQTINGDKAEQLLRFRHSNADKNGNYTTYPAEYGSDDYGRMRTQRDFISAVLKQTLKPSNIFKIGQILEIANKNVETNVELSYIKDYVPYAVEFSTDDLQTAVLPGESVKYNNYWFFAYDKKEAKELIESMFLSDSETTDSDKNNTTNTTNAITNTITSTATTKLKVELLNGSGDKEALEKVKIALEDEGYNVTKTGSTSKISKTIITNKKSATNEQLKDVKKILGTGSISTSKSSTSLVDVTIVIGTDFLE